MAKTEKIAFILEQVRLCLDRKDFVRYTDITVQQASQRFPAVLVQAVSATQQCCMQLSALAPTSPEDCAACALTQTSSVNWCDDDG